MAEYKSQTTKGNTHFNEGFYYTEMIIDIHTHTFPDSIAPKAVSKLAASAHSINHLDGTVSALYESSKRNNILSVIAPVATTPKQTSSINDSALRLNEQYLGNHLLSFGAIHPLNDNFADILTFLKDNGFRGVKIHPQYQQTNIDDLRFLNIIYKAGELGLYVLTHAGWDIGMPGADEGCIKHIKKALKALDNPHNLILAHTGGWEEWDLFLEEIAGQNVLIDTSFTISPKEYNGVNTPQLSNERFVEIIRAHGIDKVLFGSDSPWADQGDLIARIKACGLTNDELDFILFKNAQRILKL